MLRAAPATNLTCSMPMSAHHRDVPMYKDDTTDVMRPTNAIGQKIGFEYVYETEANHQDNVAALLDVYTAHLAKLDNHQEKIKKYTSQFTQRLINDYRDDRYSLQTVEKVLDHIATADSARQQKMSVADGAEGEQANERVITRISFFDVNILARVLRWRDWSFTDELVSRGIDFNVLVTIPISEQYLDYHLLHLSILCNDKDFVTRLLDGGADPNHLSAGILPLFLAFSYERQEIALLLIDRGATVLHPSVPTQKLIATSPEYQPNGVMATFLATIVPEQAAVLLNFIGDYPPLIVAITAEPACVEQLLQEGIDVNQGNIAGVRPIHYAATRHANLIPLLATKGADVNAQDVYGSTALMLAAYHSNAAIASLLQAGAQTTLVNVNGYTAMHYAVKSGVSSVAAMLHSTDINAHYGLLGTTPLHIAIQEQHLDVIEYILSRQPDVSMQDFAGQTPIHYAARTLPRLIPTLLAHGAKINDNDYQGLTPLDLALRHGHLDAMTHLLPVLGNVEGNALLQRVQKENKNIDLAALRQVLQKDDKKSSSYAGLSLTGILSLLSILIIGCLALILRIKWLSSNDLVLSAQRTVSKRKKHIKPVTQTKEQAPKLYTELYQKCHELDHQRNELNRQLRNFMNDRISLVVKTETLLQLIQHDLKMMKQEASTEETATELRKRSHEITQLLAETREWGQNIQTKLVTDLASELACKVTLPLLRLRVIFNDHLVHDPTGVEAKQHCQAVATSLNEITSKLAKRQQELRFNAAHLQSRHANCEEKATKFAQLIGHRTVQPAVVVHQSGLPQLLLKPQAASMSSTTLPAELTQAPMTPPPVAMPQTILTPAAATAAQSFLFSPPAAASNERHLINQPRRAPVSTLFFPSSTVQPEPPINIETIFSAFERSHSQSAEWQRLDSIRHESHRAIVDLVMAVTQQFADDPLFNAQFRWIEPHAFNNEQLIMWLQQSSHLDLANALAHHHQSFNAAEQAMRAYCHSLEARELYTQWQLDLGVSKIASIWN